MSAAALIAAYQSRTPIEGPYEASAPKSRGEAYGMQREFWHAICGEERPTAFKVMLPGPGEEPMAAPMFAANIVENGATLAADKLRLVGVETEICVRFGQDLPSRIEPYTREEVLDAVAAAYVAVEIVDTRLADRNAAGPLWRLADCLVNGAFVMGDEVQGWREIDTPKVIARSTVNHEVVAEVVGKHPTGEPYFLLPWWANSGSLRFGGIHEGDVVTLGSWTGMQLVDRPAKIRGELVGYGCASINIA